MNIKSQTKLKNKNTIKWLYKLQDCRRIYVNGLVNLNIFLITYLFLSINQGCRINKLQSMYIRVSTNTYTYLLFSEAGIKLILSTFQVQITCFQSSNEGSSQTRKEIQMEIINNNDSLMANNFEVTLTYFSYYLPNGQPICLL